MTTTPNPEETLLVFPCDFPIKVMGKNDPALAAFVAEAIRAQVPGFDAESIKMRESGAGKYIALTATFEAQSKAQIDAIYQAMAGHPLIAMVLQAVQIRALGRLDYLETWARMQAFTEARDASTEDALWVCEHPPVFTQGIAGKPEHLLANPQHIPVIQTDRGGQITYHGPGQAMLYCLLDLRRLGLGVRALVRQMEAAVIGFLAEHGIEAEGRVDAPGVYVQGEKIAALGLKVRKGCTYHGLSLNVRLDDNGFAYLNPCGYQGLQVTELAALGVQIDTEAAGLAVARALAKGLAARAGRTAHQSSSEI